MKKLFILFCVLAFALSLNTALAYKPLKLDSPTDYLVRLQGKLKMPTYGPVQVRCSPAKLYASRGIPNWVQWPTLCSGPTPLHPAYCFTPCGYDNRSPFTGVPPEIALVWGLDERNHSNPINYNTAAGHSQINKRYPVTKWRCPAPALGAIIGGFCFYYSLLVDSRFGNGGNGFSWTYC